MHANDVGARHEPNLREPTVLRVIAAIAAHEQVIFRNGEIEIA